MPPPSGTLESAFDEQRGHIPDAAHVAMVHELCASATVLVAHGDSGQFASALAALRCRAHALEPSAARHRAAERRLQAMAADVTVLHQDIAALNLPFRYGAMTIGARTFERIPPERVAKLLQRLRVHMVTPAALAIEVVTPESGLHPPGAPLVEVERVRLPEGAVITRRRECVVDRDARAITVIERYEQRNGATVEQREDAQYRTSWHDEQHLRAMLRDSGFRDGDWAALPLRSGEALRGVLTATT